MSGKRKNLVIAALCLIIAGTAAASVRNIARERNAEKPNPNVTLVTAPEQTDFQEHPEWTLPPVEEVDYGENIALGKEVTQNGHTQIYHCRNVNDGDRFTYWEGMADSYPNIVTIDLEDSSEITGTRILLNPNAIWSPRTQEVEIQVSEDGETFATAVEKTELSFDPMADNSVYIPLPETARARYIRFLFHSNTGADAGQAAEIEVYGS